MKKIILINILAVCMSVLVVGCNNPSNEPDSNMDSSSINATDTTDKEEDATEDGMEDTSAVEIIQNVWDLMGEDNKFPCYGGSIENSVEDGAGEVQITDTNMLTNTLLLPDDVQKNTIEAASLVHMMNTNTFTSATILLEGMDADEAADKILNNFMDTEFMCGVPEKITIKVCGDYVTYAYGEIANVDNFMSCYDSLYVASKVLDKKY